VTLQARKKERIRSENERARKTGQPHPNQRADSLKSIRNWTGIEILRENLKLMKNIGVRFKIKVKKSIANLYTGGTSRSGDMTRGFLRSERVSLWPKHEEKSGWPQRRGVLMTQTKEYVNEPEMDTKGLLWLFCNDQDRELRWRKVEVGYFEWTT
jgi:hypothetical protein